MSPAAVRTRIRRHGRPTKRLRVPSREGLVGAHTAKRETEIERTDEEPAGRGATVAPTKRAEARERERHRRERDLGRLPAGEEGALRERRLRAVSREALNEAARQADRAVRTPKAHRRRK